MLKQDIRPIRRVSFPCSVIDFRRLETPVCKLSEDKWLLYLCYLCVSGVEPEIAVSTIYNPLNKRKIEALTLKKSKQKDTERSSMLCLTGELAGMLCASVPDHVEDLYAYWSLYFSANSIPVDVNAVGLRWLRKQYVQPVARIWQALAETSFPNKQGMIEQMRGNKVNWYVDMISTMLESLEVRFDKTTLYRNVISQAFFPHS